jgi:hypothetical protein
MTDTKPSQAKLEKSAWKNKAKAKACKKKKKEANKVEPSVIEISFKTSIIIKSEKYTHI